MLKLSQSITSLAHSRLNEGSYVLWGVFLLFLTAQISVPLEPVPITLHTFGVMLIALTFERQAAIKSILSYIALGAVGVPVFANFRAGFPALIGTTGGYLFGFLVAVAVMGSLKRYLKNNNLLSVACNCLIGSIIIYTFGIGWLSRFVGFEAAIRVGFIPFIIPGIIKASLLALAIRYIKPGYIRKWL